MTHALKIELVHFIHDYIRIAQDPLFAPVHDSLDQLLDPALFVGRAPEQVSEFLEEIIDPVLLKYTDELSSIKVDELNV